MRTIKFRGKRIDNGEWVYGYFVGTTDSAVITIPFDNDIGNIDESECYYCFPETVGQFTGLLDGNGQEIFEGDIMRIPETELNIEIIGVVEFDRGSYFIRSFFSGTHSSLAWAVRERQSGERRGVVIGNIHDNPELLKGSDYE